MAQTSDYGRRCELIGERLQWNGWKPCRSVIFFFPLFFYWNGNREDNKGSEKEKATQPEQEMKTTHSWQQSCQKDGEKKSKQNTKTSLKTLLLPAKLYWKIVSFVFLFSDFFCFFSTARWWEAASRNCCYLLHLRPMFPKHGQQLKEPTEGQCRFGSPLYFYLPSPPRLPPALPFHLLH